MSARTAVEVNYTLNHPLKHTQSFSNIHTYTQIWPHTSKHMITHTHKRDATLPLHWSTSIVPFLHGALPATHSTLPECDPHVLKKEAFNLMLWSADAPNTNLIPCWIWITPLCFLKEMGKDWDKASLKKNLLWNEGMCMKAPIGFIPTVAFYQREYQSTRLTFNPRPGQVEIHMRMHIAGEYTNKTNSHWDNIRCVQIYTETQIKARLNMWTLEHRIQQSDEKLWTELQEEERVFMWEREQSKIMPWKKTNWKGFEGKCFLHQSIGLDFDRLFQRYGWSRRTRCWRIDISGLLLMESTGHSSLQLSAPIADFSAFSLFLISPLSVWNTHSRRLWNDLISSGVIFSVSTFPFTKDDFLLEGH